MKKIILPILMTFLASISTAQAQKTFKPVQLNDWENAYVNDITSLTNHDIFIYGHGQFIASPAPQNGCLIRDGKAIPLPWDIPVNTEVVFETTDGTLYLAGALGVGKIDNDLYQKLITTESYIYAMCMYNNSLYFGGSFADIGGAEGNMAKYDLSTEEITIITLPGTVRSIVPFAGGGSDTSLYVLTSEKDSAFFKLDVDMQILSMTDEEDAPKYYIGREMKTWQDKLVLTCWGDHEDGYIAVYDGYEWEFSPNVDMPSNIAISKDEELFVSGTFWSDSGVAIVSEFSTIGEWNELSDEKGRTVQSTTYGAEVYMAWNDKSQYIVMNSGTWIKDYPHYFHVFRLDSIELETTGEDILIYPNPNSGVFSIEMPDRFYDYVTLTDMSGKVILKELVFGNKFTISVNIDPGMYILKFGEGEYIQKIIITN